jgi:hypothetical protein
MSVRSTLYSTNGALIVKPLVVLAARVLGPGPLRLKLVKLAHELSDGGVVIDPTQRATRSADWHPELDRRAKSRLAFDLGPTSGQDSALVQGKQPQVAREVVAL